MDNADISDLAFSMMRLHGIERALRLADRYAAEAVARGEDRPQKKWAAVGQLIAGQLQTETRVIDYAGLYDRRTLTPRVVIWEAPSLSVS